MNSEVIREISAAIVSEQILFNWQFYSLIAAISLVVHVVGTVAGTYFGKRAESMAMAASLDEAIRQLKATTEAAEAVRLQLSKADWMDKEWRSIRRIKLEELMAAANQMVEAVPTRFSMESNGSFSDDSEKLNLLCTLYFPELRAAVSRLYIAHKQYSIHFLEKCALWRGASIKQDFPTALHIYNAFGESRKPFYIEIIAAKTALENAAAQRMLKIALHQEE